MANALLEYSQTQQSAVTLQNSTVHYYHQIKCLPTSKHYSVNNRKKKGELTFLKLHCLVFFYISRDSFSLFYIYIYFFIRKSIHNNYLDITISPV